MNKQIEDDNFRIFSLMSNYLNNYSTYITKADIDEVKTKDMPAEQAFSIILANGVGLDILDKNTDRDFYNKYFPKMVKCLKTNDYKENKYYKSIINPKIKQDNIEFKYEYYKPYEGFVFNDIEKDLEGRMYPQVGFFKEHFRYPAILENGRIWMTVTPNEIETMKNPIEKAHGKILTLGLGLGYYQYMISNKTNVDEVYIVDKNEAIINLFKKYILPQFQNKDKIKIIHADAFEFLKNDMNKYNFNFVFSDLWHDVSDGVDMYLDIKNYEKLYPNIDFEYWIEKSIKMYL